MEEINLKKKENIIVSNNIELDTKAYICGLIRAEDDPSFKLYKHLEHFLNNYSYLETYSFIKGYLHVNKGYNDSTTKHIGEILIKETQKCENYNNLRQIVRSGD